MEEVELPVLSAAPSLSGLAIAELGAAMVCVATVLDSSSTEESQASMLLRVGQESSL